MIYLINYANDVFASKQKMNSFTAKFFGKVDKVKNYSPSDLDEVFYEKNKSILNQNKGGGYWLWKPYIIKKTLEEISENDVLIYVDSGLLIIRDLRELVEILNESGNDVMLFDFPLIEIQWTQKSVFDHLEMDNEEAKFSRQFMANILIFKKTNYTINFVNEWLNLCQHPMLLISNSQIENSPFFIAHKEDQSILSVLAKKYGIVPFSDPTDYQFKQLSMIDTGRLINFGGANPKFKIEKEYFLVVRTQSTTHYVIKWMWRRLLRFIV